VSTKPKEVVVELFVGIIIIIIIVVVVVVVGGVLGNFQLEECMILSRPWNINSPYSS
jgi:hypothetical protein